MECGRGALAMRTPRQYGVGFDGSGGGANRDTDEAGAEERTSVTVSLIKRA